MPSQFDKDLTNIEAQYLGEPADRRPLFAFVLSLIFPGMGFAYLGRWLDASLVAIGGAVLWLGFAVSWMRLDFYPTQPLLGFSSGWLVLLLLQAFDASRAASRSSNYILKPTNHLVAYVTAGLLLFYLPVFGLGQWMTTQVWSVEEVRAESMYPTLLDGERVWVDRRAYSEQPPRLADVIAYRADGSEHLSFARVVGQPGQSVVVSEHGFYVDDSPAPQHHLTQDSLALVARRSGERNATSYVVEELAERRYVLSIGGDPLSSEPRRMDAEDGVLVLHDARGDLGDSRTAGSVPLAAIVGRAVFLAGGGPPELVPQRLARRVDPAPVER
ncbi:MAG: signal peptidase I [Bradymonadia bacterium]|jgi:signal peptidase I